jgi:hypothetical protein
MKSSTSMIRLLCLYLFFGLCGMLPAETPSPEYKLDRFSIINRHKVPLEKADVMSPLSVGNGEFCFTADITGLQTFDESYAAGVPLSTMADWAWHTAPPARTFSLEETFVEVKEADGRTATYPIDTSSEAASWLRANPHKFNLGRIRLQMINDQGEHPAMEDLANVRQELDLWEGFLKSRFLLDGKPVLVQTCVPPSEDAVAVRVASSLIDRYRLEVQVEFPYPSGAWGPTMNDWESPEKHQTEIISQDPHKTVLSRTMDGTHYFCTISVLPDHGAIHRVGPHTFSIRPVPGQTLDFVVAFSQDDTPSELPANFQLNRVAASQAMQKYWNSGGAIDLSASTDPRWKELERRLVLSQYLMAIQGRGRYPSQETGLTCNSWHGKFHLEMHWWHAVHFALWGREEILEKQMAWYLDTMPVIITRNCFTA